jgi:hypothetical protein
MPSDDQAKAVAETAKFGTELVKAGESVGSYLTRVFGRIPDNLIGVIGGDWLEHKRRRNLAVLEANTTAFLEGIDKSRISDPSPSVLLPLMQAAMDESREELQALWAALLARSIIDEGRDVRRIYLSLLNQMDPSDVKVMEGSFNLLLPILKGFAPDFGGHLNEINYEWVAILYAEKSDYLEQIAESFHDRPSKIREAVSSTGLTYGEWQVSMARLNDLNLLKIIPLMHLQDGVDLFLPTPLGIAFAAACQPPI